MNGPIKFVTGNSNKCRETGQILGLSEDQMVRVDVDLQEIQGTSEEVIRDKVSRAATKVGYPCMVMDTSLCANALGHLPGPYIKSFIDSPGVDGIHKMLIGFNDFSGYALCLVAIQMSADEGPIIFEGRVDGTVGPVQGDSGFGWDPIFTPLGHTVTFAQMDAETKNGISHRYRALNKLSSFLESQKVTA